MKSGDILLRNLRSIQFRNTMTVPMPYTPIDFLVWMELDRNLNATIKDTAPLDPEDEEWWGIKLWIRRN